MSSAKTVHCRGDRKTTVAITPKTHKELKRCAVDMEEHVSHLAEKLISAGLKQLKKKARAAA